MRKRRDRIEREGRLNIYSNSHGEKSPKKEMKEERKRPRRAEKHEIICNINDSPYPSPHPSS
jgi:hypothetical protein